MLKGGGTSLKLLRAPSRSWKLGPKKLEAQIVRPETHLNKSRGAIPLSEKSRGATITYVLVAMT